MVIFQLSAMVMPESQKPFFRSEAPELVFSAIYLRPASEEQGSAFPSTVSGLRFPPLINHEKTAFSRQSLQKGLRDSFHGAVKG